MSDLHTELELARALFGPQSSSGLGVRRVTATATSDSSAGSVAVDVGGEVVEVPVIGAVSTGDEVQLLVDNGAPIAVAATGWGDELSGAVTTAQTAADEAAAAAEATGQHFWTDTSGVHVTTSEGSTTGPNVLLNSQGQLFRDGSDTLASFTPSGVSFYDASGDTTASFNSSGAVVGSTGSVHVAVDSSQVAVADPNGTAVKLGYGTIAGTRVGRIDFLPGSSSYGSIFGNSGTLFVNAPPNGVFQLSASNNSTSTGSYPYLQAMFGGLGYTSGSSALLIASNRKGSSGTEQASIFNLTNSGVASTCGAVLTKHGGDPASNAIEVYNATSATGTPALAIGWDGTIESSAYGVSTVSGWTVERRPGGIIEATRTITGSLAVTSSYAGRYISALQSTSLPSGLFSTIDWAGVEVAYSPGLWSAHLTTASTSTINYYIACNASTTANITRRVYVRGR